MDALNPLTFVVLIVPVLAIFIPIIILVTIVREKKDKHRSHPDSSGSISTPVLHRQDAPQTPAQSQQRMQMLEQGTFRGTGIWGTECYMILRDARTGVDYLLVQNPTRSAITMTPLLQKSEAKETT